jgi:hypothetical protein
MTHARKGQVVTKPRASRLLAHQEATMAGMKDLADTDYDPNNFLALRTAARNQYGISVTDDQNREDLYRALLRLRRHLVGKCVETTMIRDLQKLQGPHDTMTAHASADQMLCRLLTVLGFERVVKEWQRIDKFYG